MSDSQANAEALARRGSPYTAASQSSFTVAWDFHNRQPDNLRDAVRQVRRAYADEVPSKLHEGPDSIGEGGTPRMTARAEGYMFGSGEASDAKPDPETGEYPLISYYHAPFKATLSRMSRSENEGQRKRAAIVQHVAIGRTPPREAALMEDVPYWCARVVAEDALFGFLRSMTDLKIHAARVQEDDEAVA